MERSGKSKLMIGGKLGLWRMNRAGQDVKKLTRKAKREEKVGQDSVRDKGSEPSYFVLSWRFLLLEPAGYHEYMSLRPLLPRPYGMISQ